jgi:hypothetical protein
MKLIAGFVAGSLVSLLGVGVWAQTQQIKMTTRAGNEVLVFSGDKIGCRPVAAQTGDVLPVSCRIVINVDGTWVNANIVPSK